MTLPRQSLVCVDDTPYYHVVSRCVRRAFLCGIDHYSGQCFEHRREWIQERLATLESIFAIDVAAYAVMSNHCHLVLKLCPESAENWQDKQIVMRWGRLFQIPLLVEEWLDGKHQTGAVQAHVKSLIDLWKSRLCDLSWFMRCLNEHVARLANAEDTCTGRFWEGRFKSQALLDETALLTCMTYVDLNPIRAGIAQTPEDSDFTSVQQRIEEGDTVNLLPFDPSSSSEYPGIPFEHRDYLELIDWTGRAVLEDKRGSIPEYLPKILDRLGIGEDVWLTTMRGYSGGFRRAVGPLDKIQSLCERIGQRWLCGRTANRILYLPAVLR